MAEKKTKGMNNIKNKKKEKNNNKKKKRKWGGPERPVQAPGVGPVGGVAGTLGPGTDG